MPETAITPQTSPGKWSQTGSAITMTAVDASNGNKFAAANDQALIVQNTHNSSLSFQLTSSAIAGSGAGAGRTGNVNQSMAAGELRFFRLTKNGWQDANGNVLIPSGLNTLLKVGIINLTD